MREALCICAGRLARKPKSSTKHNQPQGPIAGIITSITESGAWCFVCSPGACVVQLASRSLDSLCLRLLKLGGPTKISGVLLVFLEKGEALCFGGASKVGVATRVTDLSGGTLVHTWKGMLRVVGSFSVTIARRTPVRPNPLGLQLMSCRSRCVFLPRSIKLLF